jgi:hypothetical protein
VQPGATRVQAQPRELVHEERDRMGNDVVLAQTPEVAKYAHRAGRIIPVAVLQPLNSRVA